MMQGVVRVQWIFLWVVLGEAVSLAFAGVMRCMGELEPTYENMEEGEADRLRMMEMQSISASVASKADKHYDRYG
jgi:hypothetical protein